MKRIKNGKDAEEIALSYERVRLSRNSTMKPKFVGDRARNGFDIESYESVTDSSPRYIEVKAWSEGKDIFVTERERANLTALGDAAWIYLVDLNLRKVVRTIQDPFTKNVRASVPLIYKIKI